jgi:hypothetical protein
MGANSLEVARNRACPLNARADLELDDPALDLGCAANRVVSRHCAWSSRSPAYEVSASQRLQRTVIPVEQSSARAGPRPQAKWGLMSPNQVVLERRRCVR